MENKRGPWGSANDEPVTFGYNTTAYGDIVSQQIKLAGGIAQYKKNTKEQMDAEIASETERINTLAANPSLYYTEGDRVGHIKRSTEEIKNKYKYRRLSNNFDFNKRQSKTTRVPSDRGNIDILSSQTSSEILQDFAKKKKKRYIG
jgi:protein involved in polysaccharide export with SLBB domain